MAGGRAAPARREYGRAPCERGVHTATASLAVMSGRGVRIFAEGMCVALRENLHHPAIKIIHRVVHDGFEPPVVFSMSFVNVITQSDADIFVLPAEAHLLRS